MMPGSNASIVVASDEHLDSLVSMGLALWPDYPRDELTDAFVSILRADKFRVMICFDNGDPVGFVYIGIRTDYVEGSDTSPTGYIEGIYVKPAHRKKKIAKQLLENGEQWLRSKGCKQIGSDIYINNTLSYHFHTHIGFREAGRLIAFIKDL